MENKKKTLREHGVEYTYDERFLPLTQKEMQLKGWEQPDFVYVIGDAYVDHPSFGPAIISRVLEAHGYKVAIISQPDWKDENSIAIYGRPKLAFLVCAGNMDSMVNHYTVSKKRRHTDAYTPGGEMGKRQSGYRSVSFVKYSQFTDSVLLHRPESLRRRGIAVPRNS